MTGKSKPSRSRWLDLHPPSIGEMAPHVPARTREKFPAPPKPAKSYEAHSEGAGRYRMDHLRGGQGDKAKQRHAGVVHGKPERDIYGGPLDERIRA